MGRDKPWLSEQRLTKLIFTMATLTVSALYPLTASKPSTASFSVIIGAAISSIWGEKIYAEEAKQLGLASQVMPLNKLLDRAWEIARTKFLPNARVQRRLTRSLLIQPWRKLLTK
jgi:hypothetical protein